EVQRFAGHGIEDRFVAGDAALADWVEKNFGSRRCGGNFVKYFETRAVWGEQFVARVLVGFRLLRRRRGRGAVFLRKQRGAGTSQKERANRACGMPAHELSLLRGMG